MRSLYREIAPAPDLAPLVESFWTGQVQESFSARILPDGCADILFTIRDDELVDLQVVGVMTRPHIVPLAAGTFLLGVRFQPGMAGACLQCDLPKLNDRMAPLQSVCRGIAEEFVRLKGTTEARIAAIEDRLSGLPRINRLQRAIVELVGHKGQLSIDELAALAGLGQRQLRRTCLKQSGLGPKHLARVLRFRHAVARLRNGESDLTGMAFDCGYYDQSHMTRDFRELSGITPAAYLRCQ